MKQKMNLTALLMVLCFIAQGAAYADSCALAEREMVYGHIALQDAREKQDFLESAKQFEAAVGKAPSCADAHFNLGAVYEKAGEYQKSLNALKKYLSLAPGSSDAGKVQKKIYELEYRAKKANSSQSLFKSIAGRWNARCLFHNGSWKKLVYNFTVSADRVDYEYNLPGVGIVGTEYPGMKYDFTLNRFACSSSGDISSSNCLVWVRSKNLMESFYTDTFNRGPLSDRRACIFKRGKR